MPFENIVGKGENAGNQHFLLFPQGFPFLPYPNIFPIFQQHLLRLLQMFSFSTGLKFYAWYRVYHFIIMWRLARYSVTQKCIKPYFTGESPTSIYIYYVICKIVQGNYFYSYVVG